MGRQRPGEVTLERAAAVLEGLGFNPLVRPDRLVIGAHAFTVALWIDYARVTGMWDTGRDALDAFLPLWLVCNDVNERTCATAAYLHEFDGAAHMHAESTMLVAEGAAPEQVGEFVVSAMAACLAAIDHVSQQTAGHSVVDWPGRR